MSAHWYDADGNLVNPWTKGAYPSISTILDRIKSDSYDSLVRRLGQEAADKLMKKASERGTRVHKACELWLGNGYDDVAAIEQAELEDGEDKYFYGFVEWFVTYEPVVIASELFVRSKKYKYAGRLDIAIMLAGEPWIVDIKTGQDNVRHGLQLKGYAVAFQETIGVRPRMGVLALDPKRSCGYRNSRQPYGLQEYAEPLAALVAHRDVFRWWNKKQPAAKPVDSSLIWKENQ